MSSSIALLETMIARGVRLQALGDRLHVEAPPGVLTDSDRKALAEAKQPLLDLLANQCTWCGSARADGGPDPTGAPWCVACRDAEQALQAVPPALVEGRDLRADWAGAIHELGELVGYPRLSFKEGHSVALGPLAWHKFVARASVEDLQLVLARLRELVSELPRPDMGAS